jgi:K+-transporting ATPase ATPase A chain
MSSGWAGLLQVLVLVLALGLSYRPLGDYIAHLLTSSKHWRLERGLYKFVGVDADADQKWSAYLRGVLAFSAIGVLLLYLILRVQDHLMLALGMPKMQADQAFNTAASFVTNTNWQSYAGENTLGYVAQMTGLAVQNFVSAAVGICIVATLIRGFTRTRSDRLGNFWVDLTRITLRLLLPMAVIATVVLVAGGVVQNLHGYTHVTTLSGGHQTIPGGAVASQEVIKELGTNGGGAYNANSAHPFENPNPFTNVFEIYLLLVISFSLPRTFGRMVRDNRQGYAILSVMGIIWAGSVAAMSWFESHPTGSALKLAHSAMEGKEVRFGIPGSALFASSTTLTSTGAVNSAHDSLTAGGGGVALFDMMLGEVAPGGTGSGLYGMLILAILAVFISGLMVGRTPEYLGKKIRPAEMKYAALYVLATPACALIGTGMAIGMKGQEADINAGNSPGPHGLSEVLYAFTSTSNNNGSAFAGLNANTTWFNVSTGLAMLTARFVPMIFVVVLAASLGKQQHTPASAGTLATHKPLFVGMLLGTVLIVVGLTYFPALALGPFAEGLH